MYRRGASFRQNNPENAYGKIISPKEKIFFSKQLQKNAKSVIIIIGIPSTEEE